MHQFLQADVELLHQMFLNMWCVQCPHFAIRQMCVHFLTLLTEHIIQAALCFLQNVFAVSNWLYIDGISRRQWWNHKKTSFNPLSINQALFFDTLYGLHFFCNSRSCWHFHLSIIESTFPCWIQAVFTCTRYLQAWNSVLPYIIGISLAVYCLRDTQQ